MPDLTYGPKVYFKQGANELVVASGGTLTIESGGSFAPAAASVWTQYDDSVGVYFGTSQDVSMMWDATNFIIAAAADDSLIEIGDAAATQLSFDVKLYGNGTNGGDYLYFDASANLLYTTGVDVQFKDNDFIVIGTGAGAAGDVNITWDATNLIIAAVADDTLIEVGDAGATQKSFDVKIYGNAANGADYLLWDASASALSMGGAAGMASTNGILGASTAAAGNASGNAGALPAGTGLIYPTTAADDTKGVILSASDQVTGRMLFIGNGVSNKILKVYPPSGGTINGANADVAFSSASGKGVIIACLSGAGNTWLAW